MIHNHIVYKVILAFKLKNPNKLTGQQVGIAIVDPQHDLLNRYKLMIVDSNLINQV